MFEAYNKNQLLKTPGGGEPKLTAYNKPIAKYQEEKTTWKFTNGRVLSIQSLEKTPILIKHMPFHYIDSESKKISQDNSNESQSTTGSFKRVNITATGEKIPKQVRFVNPCSC